MDEEIWKPIEGFEHYEVSDQGRVRSLDRVMSYPSGRVCRWRGRVLKPTVNTYGHFQVGLRTETERYDALIHVLVLQAFVGPRPPGMEACHGPGGKTDNRVSNLRWDTHSNNMKDRARDGTDSNLNRTHCPAGHPYAGENLYVDPRGYRRCRTCRREQG